MPGTLKGFGATNIGKGNLYATERVCEKCGTFARLTSYDTECYFALGFTPIISMGKRRILTECPNCNISDCITQTKYGKMIQEAKEALYRELNKSVPDSGRVVECLNEYYIFQDPTVFKEIAYDVIEKCKNKIRILNQLCSLFLYYNDVKESLAIALLGFKLDTSDNQKELIAQLLVYNYKPQEAELYLENIWTKDSEEAFLDALFLVEGYCATADYENASRIVEKIERAFSNYQYSEQLQAMVQFIDAGKESGKAKVSRRIKSTRDCYHNKKSLDNRHMLIAPVVLTVMIIIYFSVSFYFGMFRTVHILNGTSLNYTVKIGDTEVNLPPFAKKKIHLKEGIYHLTTNDLDDKRNSQSFTISEINFLLRPFVVPFKTLVLNPDHCAILYKEIAKYNKYGNIKPTYEYYSLGHFYNFDDINYPFNEFPETVSLDDDSDVVTKIGLDFISDFGRVSPIYSAISYLSEDSAQKFIEAYASVNPYDYDALSTYIQNNNDKAFETLEPLLDAKPVYVEAHKLYQILRKIKTPEYALLEEYQKRLNKDSLNADLLYLTGRLLDGDDEVAMYGKALALPKPSTDAMNALAEKYYSVGNFENSMTYAKMAVESKPAKTLFKETYRNNLYALGKLDELLPQVEKMYRTDSSSSYYLAFMYEVLLKMGEQEKAEKSVRKYISYLRRNGYANIPSYKDYFKIHKAITLKDSETLKSLYQSIEGYGFFSALLEYDFQKCDEELNTSEETDYTYFLAASIIASNSNNSVKASQYYNQAISDFKEYGDLYKDCISLMEKKSIKLADVESISMHPEEKALLLTALGYKHKSLQKKLFQEAQRYNFKTSAMKSILDTVL